MPCFLVLKAGEISEIVESEIGFHLVLCKQIQRAETLSLQKATPKIRANNERTFAANLSARMVSQFTQVIRGIIHER